MTNLDHAPSTGADANTDGQLVDVDSITPDKSLLADVQRTRVTTPLTRVLLTLVAVSAVFLAGALVERTLHKTSNNATGVGALAAQFRNRFGGQGGTGGSGGGGFGAANGATIGTVKLVDGKNVYIQDFSGNVVKVTTNASTDINLTTKGAVSQLEPGTSVIVQGAASNDGTTAATSISQNTGLGNGSPFGGAGAGGGRAPGSGSGG